MRKALIVAAMLLVGTLMSCELAAEPPVVNESVVHVADDKGQGVGPCVVSSDNMAECPLVGVAVHTTKHGPRDCPDGRRYYNSTGTYPDGYEN